MKIGLKILSAGNHAAFGQLMMKVCYSNVDNLGIHMVQDVATLYVRLRKDLQMSNTSKKVAPIVSVFPWRKCFINFKNRSVQNLHSKVDKIIAGAKKQFEDGKMDEDEFETIKASHNENMNKVLEGSSGNSATKKYARWKHQRGTFQSLDWSVDKSRKMT